MTEKIKTLAELFEATAKIKVPSYQRAYAWNEEQLSQFVNDMIEMEGKEYYYGHFILEESNNPNESKLEVIDGQQRLTTLILFLQVCRLFKTDGLENYIDKFETVDYDLEAFEKIKNGLKNTKIDWTIKEFGYEGEPTLSIGRVLFALNYFRKLFIEEKNELKLESAKIDTYIKTLTNAHISTHITNTKAISVQIFELQNSRGIKLNLLEKVKAKLMKAIYLNAEAESQNKLIDIIQKQFGEIYHLEESTSTNAFRGELTLDDILFYHLRIVDDGLKLSADNKTVFNDPVKHGDKERSILSYLDKKINVNQPKTVVNYIMSLTEKFKDSVEFVSINLSEIDKQNTLVGDVLILNKSLSLEFLLLLWHKNLTRSINNKILIEKWEKFLFTRDFHDKYYHQVYRDNFELLFYEISLVKIEKEVEDKLNKFLQDGFRPDLMEEGNLIKTVSNYLIKNKSNILNNAYFWSTEKMVYALYKYEKNISANAACLRDIMKAGRSIEHILPQEWSWEWIGETPNNVTENGHERNKKINSTINGIGNLLLITASENSSLSNTNPKDKIYKSCIGGSYENHNKNKHNWENHTEWENLIQNRGVEIYNFLEEFITKN